MEGSIWKDVLTTLGIDPTQAVAGFSGGVVNALRMRAVNAATTAVTTVSGTLVAVYVGAPIADIAHTPTIATCFVVGYGGVQVLEYLFSILRERLTSGTSPGDRPPANGGHRDASA